MEPITKINLLNLEKFLIIKNLYFTTPNVPNFKTNAAKIIEQVPEALPWALGSQKCKNTTGILFRKIKIKQIRAQ